MTKNFIEKQFPVDISYGSSGGPEYFTEVLSTTNGGEFRSSRIYNSKMRFNISTGIKNKRQMEQIITFFRCCKGRNTAFRYKDWSDFKGQNESVQIVDQHTLQLTKTYSLEGNTIETRIITKPVKNTVKLYNNGKIIPITQLQIDYATGRITLLNNEFNIKNTGFTADFEFDVPVRFDTDYLPVTIENHNFYSLPEIELIEIKIQ